MTEEPSSVERLDVRLRRGAVEFDEVVAIALLLAGHLDALHAAGRTDGAIAPTRVLVPPLGGAPTLEPDVDGPQRAYTAPEVWLGAPTPASDQFAMAAILYEALCGGRAFPGDDSEKIRISMSTGRRVPLAARVPGLADAVDGVFERGLAVDPEERFPDCRSFADALVTAIDRSRIAAGEVLVQKPSSRPSSMRPSPMRTHGAGRWSGGTIIALLVGVIVAAAILSWLTR